MATRTLSHRKKPAAAATIVEAYDIAADAKKRISLRKAGAKYFHVMALSNGSYFLQPRVLVPLKLRIDQVEAVPPPKGIRPLLHQLGQALDRLPAR